MMNSQRLTAAFGIQGFLVAVCLGVTAPGFAGAADFDGSHKLLCAPTDAVQCEGAGECERAEVEDLNIPKFLTIDFKGKKLTGTVEGGASEEATEIQNSARPISTAQVSVLGVEKSAVPKLKQRPSCHSLSETQSAACPNLEKR